MKKTILIFLILTVVLGLSNYISSGPLNNETLKKIEKKETKVETQIIKQPAKTEFVEKTNLKEQEIEPTPNVQKEELQKEVNNKNFIVAIDAGHQLKGNNEKEPIGPGALESKPKVSQGTTGIVTKIPEYQMTLEISLKLKEALIKEGYQVVMTRESHEVNLSNSERAEIANNSGADIFIRIHGNGSEDSSVKGILTLCPTKNNEYCSNIYEDSYNLSTLIVDELSNSTGDKNLGVSQVDNMSGINWCKIPVSIVEVGFMSNEETDLLLATDEYQEKIIKGLIKAINLYYKEKEGL